MLRSTCWAGIGAGRNLAATSLLPQTIAGDVARRNSDPATWYRLSATWCRSSLPGSAPDKLTAARAGAGQISPRQALDTNGHVPYPGVLKWDEPNWDFSLTPSGKGRGISMLKFSAHPPGPQTESRRQESWTASTGGQRGQVIANRRAITRKDWRPSGSCTPPPISTLMQMTWEDD